jgi:lipid II:glycine glycyltransferase (peptidoglycan interpeptide bridge formation enzyme)
MPIMRLDLARKHVDCLVPTPLLHQTAFWGRVQHRLGVRIDAFDLAYRSPSRASTSRGDFLVVRTPLAGDRECAYVPWGPEVAPDAESVGTFLERASRELRPMLGARCAFVRWDLPWTSLHAREPDDFSQDGAWRGPPAGHLRELRVNFGTTEHNLHKAPRDLLPADTVLVDLSASDDVILGRMHPKTRYNIGLARRRGVVVEAGGRSDLGAWYEVYRETAARNRFTPLPFARFDAFLAETAEGSASPVTPLMLLARHEGRLLAGVLLAIGSSRATYMYGASTRDRPDVMAPYALQWAAIQRAKAHGCDDYDMFGAAPRSGAAHPLARVHRFKIGFGGSLVHREGCWDYPYDEPTYAAFRRWEEATTVQRAIRGDAS